MVVTHYFPAHRGGIERVADDLARTMLKSGDVTIQWFASDCDAPPPSSSHFTAIPVPSWNGLEERSGLPYPLWSPAAWPRLWRSIRQCDAVHVHDYLYMGSLLAWTMAKFSGRPVVFTQHVGHVPLRNAMLTSMLRLMNVSLGRFMLAHSAAAVFVSNRVRDQFFPHGGNNLHLIANGIDTTTFQPAPEEQRQQLRATLGLDSSRPVLLFVGRFVAKKGLPLLRTLVDGQPHAQWLFAGRGPLDPGSWDRPDIRVFRDRSGPALAELYQAADLLVLPSAGEGFPLVVQEALACGTPSLAGSELSGALPGIDDVLLTESVSGEDAAARWNARLGSLVKQANVLASLRQRAAAFAARNWSWDTCARTYRDLYRQSAGRNDGDQKDLS